jgi:hypothetical protein
MFVQSLIKLYKQNFFCFKYKKYNMKKNYFVLTFAMSSNLPSSTTPKLVVGIVVENSKWKMEYLYRFSDDFSRMVLKD